MVVVETYFYAEGGSAIELDNGNITGNGKVVAIGGDVLWGNGGNAVIGNGMITTSVLSFRELPLVLPKTQHLEMPFPKM